MKFKLFTISFLMVLFATIALNAQNLPITVEAESGTLGSNYSSVEAYNANAITISTNLINSLNPGSADRVASYEVTFPGPGTYDLYAKVLTGAGTFDDDSYFIGNGFGEKNNSLDADWLMANGLAGVGYDFYNAVVDGLGATGSEVWKWLNFSEFLGNGTPITFTVDAGSLTQTFQIGAREDGLYIDKFVFADSELFFTVDKLNKGEQGLTEKPTYEPTGTPIAAGKSKFLGCAWDYAQSYDFPSFWNQSTPGNAGKWGSVENTRDVMDWSVLDSTYNVAKRYGMLFKEHTLFWGAQQPAWMNGLSATEQREEIIEWLEALSTRYPDIDQIDVVNEPIHNAPNGMLPWGSTTPNIDYSEALGGAGASGWEWLVEAFRLARQYFPNAKLILNEYSVINDNATTQKYIEIIELLKAENLIDGIGEQAHAFTTQNQTTASLKANLDKLAATGIPLYMTELDIDGLKDDEQLAEMQRIFSLFWEHEAIQGITLWGFRYGVWRNDEGAYLINEDGSERPALKWLKAYVNDTLKNVESINVSGANGNSAIDEQGGTLQMIASVLPADATILGVNWKTTPSNIASIDENGLLTALQNGTVTVTAKTWDGTGTEGTKEIVISNQGNKVNLANIENIKVFPNPASDGKIHIRGIANAQLIEILDMTGKLVSSYKNNMNENTTIEMNQSKGVFIVRIHTHSDLIYRKIVLQ